MFQANQPFPQLAPPHQIPISGPSTRPAFASQADPMALARFQIMQQFQQLQQQQQQLVQSSLQSVASQRIGPQEDASSSHLQKFLGHTIFGPPADLEPSREKSNGDPIIHSDEEPAAKRQKVKKYASEEIKRVQRLIEECLTDYLSLEEIAEKLSQHSRPEFTRLVWQKLQAQNKDFFNAYELRTQLKKQITMFNTLIQQQACAMQICGKIGVVNVKSPPISPTIAPPPPPPAPPVGGFPFLAPSATGTGTSPSQSSQMFDFPTRFPASAATPMSGSGSAKLLVQTPPQSAQSTNQNQNHFPQTATATAKSLSPSSNGTVVISQGTPSSLPNQNQNRKGGTPSPPDTQSNAANRTNLGRRRQVPPLPLPPPPASEIISDQLRRQSPPCLFSEEFPNRMVGSLSFENLDSFPTNEIEISDPVIDWGESSTPASSFSTASEEAPTEKITAAESFSFLKECSFSSQRSLFDVSKILKEQPSVEEEEDSKSDCRHFEISDYFNSEPLDEEPYFKA